MNNKAVRIGTNMYDLCACGQRKVYAAKTCRTCMQLPNERPVVAAGQRFRSLGKAARALGISYQLIRYRCSVKSFSDYYYEKDGTK